MEYTIEKISQDEPREYNGANGTVYYIKVKLSGHDKAVSIGKKSPNALKVGDKVTGTITETQYDADKFTAEKPAFNGGGHGGSSYTPRDDSAIQAQWAIGQAVSVLNACTGPGVAAPNADVVIERTEPLAKAFFAMIDRVKNSNKSTEDKPQEEKPARDWNSVGKATAEQEAVHTVFDENEPINLDDIPF